MPMHNPPAIQTAIGGFSDYALLDSGRRYKLERFGSVTVVRGEPNAWWEPRLPSSEWDRAQAVHDEDAGWELQPGCPREWSLHYNGLTFGARISDTSKHLGLFPEQSPHWRAIHGIGRALQTQPHRSAPPRLLNLFGYTGAATLVAARSGWQATQVDASKPATAWARDNQLASGLAAEPIRWIVEDAMKYVRREIKRGSRYDGILLDPPAFGRGPTGNVWKVEHHLPELLALCRDVLTEKPALLLLTTYNIEASSLMLHNLLADLMAPYGGHLEAGELALPHASDAARFLPLSIYARWSHLPPHASHPSEEPGGERE
ncbi:MAG: class I SAM-dependent methyltransferase [Verrucomicrobiota bacterium]|jgi:23S rRNA (cytosine1962-C5)-methyltransferase|nr:class I SAM-dependent methyltransferase [Verrucomicrobiota bacterium]